MELNSSEIIYYFCHGALGGGVAWIHSGEDPKGGLEGEEVLEGEKLQGGIPSLKVGWELVGREGEDLLGSRTGDEVEQEAGVAHVGAAGELVQVVGADSFVEVEPHQDGLADVIAGHRPHLASKQGVWYPGPMKSAEEQFRESLEAGIELFNQGLFMEAYEVWEERWVEDAGEGTELLQGLLQISVGLAKLKEGSPRGTVKLLNTGLALIDPYRPEVYDIDVEALVEVVTSYRAKAEALIAEGREGGNTVVARSSAEEEITEEQPGRRPFWRRFWGRR